MGLRVVLVNLSSNGSYPAASCWLGRDDARLFRMTCQPVIFSDNRPRCIGHERLGTGDPRASAARQEPVPFLNLRKSRDICVTASLATIYSDRHVAVCLQAPAGPSP